MTGFTLTAMASAITTLAFEGREKGLFREKQMKYKHDPPQWLLSKSLFKRFSATEVCRGSMGICQCSSTNRVNRDSRPDVSRCHTDDRKDRRRGGVEGWRERNIPHLTSTTMGHRCNFASAVVEFNGAATAVNTVKGTFPLGWLDHGIANSGVYTQIPHLE
ncbi:hypothetical protein PAMP_000948 [Pampus punctatissimus]